VLGQPEVHHLDEIELESQMAEMDVCGLYVPVEKASLMGFGQRTAGLLQDVRHPARGLGAEAPDQVLQSNTIQQLHDQVHLSLAGDAEVVELHRVGASERRGRIGLPQEPPDRGCLSVGVEA